MVMTPMTQVQKPNTMLLIMPPKSRDCCDVYRVKVLLSDLDRREDIPAKRKLGWPMTVVKRR